MKEAEHVKAKPDPPAQSMRAKPDPKAVSLKPGSGLEGRLLRVLSGQKEKGEEEVGQHGDRQG